MADTQLYTIRKTRGSKITPEQLKRLITLAKQLDEAEAGYEGSYGLKPKRFDDENLRKWIPTQTAYTAHKDGKTVGMALASPSSRFYDNMDYVSQVVVDPAHRGKGVGRALLRRAILDSVRAKRQISLRVNANNPAGLHLYESMGFKPFSHAMVYQGEKKAGFAAKVASVLLKAAAVAAPTYAVASGDTLSAIARRNGTTARELARINAIKNPDRLRIGQKLRLPAPRPPVRSVPASKPPVRSVPAGRPQAGPVARAGVRPAFPGKNNNPVNMRYYGVGWNGERPAGLSKGDFTRFDTPQNGARAGIRNLMTLGKRHGFTLNGIMPKFSPSSENDTGRHIRNISSISNLPPDKVLDPKNTGQMVDLLRGVIGAESGRKVLNWFKPVELTNAVIRARKP